MTREEINIGKKPTEQESNFMNSFIWYKPKYGYFNPLTGLNAIQISKLYEADSPHFLGENLFLNPFTNKWIEWTEKFRNELKKHYAVPAKPQQVSIPATENELKKIQNMPYIKAKGSGNIYAATSYELVVANKNNFYIYNPDTKCWEDWGEK